MIVSLDVAAAPAYTAARAPASVVVVLDVLRATSSIVTALDNGAAGMIPVREADEAIAVMRRIGRERVLLCGERDSTLIQGFDLDNSPASYTRERVAGKTLVFTTTNGTRALTEAAHAATTIYCASLLNRKAIVQRLIAAGGDTRLLCSGDRGALSFEDMLGAGAIVEALVAHDRRLAITDAARVAATVFAANAKRLTTAIASGTHARTLIAAGFARDVATCARIDVSDCVPLYADGVITKL
jgi:2-phosphosulfolactate phosphatase